MPVDEQKKKAVENFLEILEEEGEKKKIIAFLYDEKSTEFCNGFIDQPYRGPHWTLGYGESRKLPLAMEQLLNEKEPGQVLENVVLILPAQATYGEEDFKQFEELMKLVEKAKIYICMNIVKDENMMIRIVKARNAYSALGLVDIDFATEEKYAINQMVRFALNQRFASEKTSGGIVKSGGIQKNSGPANRSSSSSNNRRGRGSYGGYRRGGFKRKYDEPESFSRKNRRY